MHRNIRVAVKYEIEDREHQGVVKCHTEYKYLTVTGKSLSLV